MYTLSEASEYLHVHPNTLRRWDKIGFLKSERYGERGDRRYTKKTLDLVISKGRNQFKGPHVKDKPHVGVGVIITDVDAKKILLKEREKDFRRGDYALPGGRIGFGESPKDAIINEIYDQIGIKLDVNPISTISTADNIEEGFHSITVIFKATLDGDRFDGNNGWKWFSIDCLPNPLFGASRDAIEAWKSGKQYNF